MPARTEIKNRNGSTTAKGKLYIDPKGQQKVSLLRHGARVNGQGFTITESADGLKVTIEFNK
jgi:hypothetical protein